MSAAPSTPRPAAAPRAELEQAFINALQPLRQEILELRRAQGASASLASFCQAFRLAFFNGKADPLALPNVDYLITSSVLNGIRFERYEPELKRLTLSKDGLLFATDAYFYVMLELFAQRQYASLPTLVGDRPFVVYDVGMNRGYAALAFAAQPGCRAVHGFELLDRPFEWARHNFSLNPGLAPKFFPQLCGLGGENKTVELIFEASGDGISTIEPDFFATYWTPQRREQSLRKTVSLRRASEAFAELPRYEAGVMRVLKIDVEGAEYEIISELAAAGLLDFDFVLAEAHLGLEKFLELLPDYRVVECVQHTALMANVVLERNGPARSGRPSHGVDV